MKSIIPGKKKKIANADKNKNSGEEGQRDCVCQGVGAQFWSF